MEWKHFVLHATHMHACIFHSGVAEQNTYGRMQWIEKQYLCFGVSFD